MIKYVVIAVIVGGVWLWWNKPAYVQPNNCRLEDLADPKRIERAIKKMGPYYNYIVEADGTLKVNRGDGKWLVLKY